MVGSLTQSLYHLHEEGGWLSGTDLLSTAAPDAASTSVQSPDLNGLANGATTSVESFTTQPVVPGYIPGNTNVTFSLWLKESASIPGLYPDIAFGYAQSSGNVFQLCSIMGTTALSTTPTQMQVSCSLGSNGVMFDTTMRPYVSVSVTNSSGAPLTQDVTADLEIEGTINGDYDSTVTIPEILFPFISSLSPATGSEGTTVTINGGEFGSSQGSSTVTFNGLTSTPSSWSDTSISVPVPTGATTGPVIVTTGGQPTNSVTFTVAPAISELSPSSGPVGTTVTISGASFGSTQGSSFVSFNGTRAVPISWNDTSIVADVPLYTTSGPVTVTVASNAASSPTNFTVTPYITGIAPAAGPVGSLVSITGFNFSPGGTVSFNGVGATTVGNW